MCQYNFRHLVQDTGIMSFYVLKTPWYWTCCSESCFFWKPHTYTCRSYQPCLYNWSTYGLSSTTRISITPTRFIWSLTATSLKHFHQIKISRQACPFHLLLIPLLIKAGTKHNSACFDLIEHISKQTWSNWPRKLQIQILNPSTKQDKVKLQGYLNIVFTQWLHHGITPLSCSNSGQ